MGNACCVAPRDKMVLLPNLPSAAAATERRHSPTWSFRWDNYNRGCVAGDDTSLSWLSDGFSRNDASDIKSDFVSSQGSPLDSFRTHTLQNSPASVPRSHIDDEYAKATEKNPKILLTTSRDPSAPLTRFVKELKNVFPNAKRMNRGGQVISEIIEMARSHDYSDVIFVTENRGKPDGLIVSHLPFGPTAYFQLLNVVTRHEIQSKKAMGKMSEQYPHVIFDNFTSQMGKRVASMLKHMFPVPKLDARRIVTFHNKSDDISFRNHVYDKGEGGPKSIELKEVGPRFELRLYQVKLGTMEQEEADMEWVLRPYMNSAKRRHFIGQ